MPRISTPRTTTSSRTPGDYDAERADAGGYGPGPGPYPGRPYPQGGTSHLGWTR